MTSPSTLLVLWLLVALLTSVLIGFIGGALTRHNGNTWATAICAGGGAFAGAFTIGLLTLNTLLPN
ncbi:hypothetical protein [Nocardia sp. CC201C]|uniref:hypothetical protein n=1 Tax=Nocardia sp. CC201C TaxID=3044575 RepID=UPI0024A9724E|nr:hypothetical protein [Nocardia sp. CC201C]